MTDFNSFRNAVFCWLVGWLVGLFWRGLFMGKQSLYNLLALRKSYKASDDFNVQVSRRITL